MIPKTLILFFYLFQWHQKYGTSQLGNSFIQLQVSTFHNSHYILALISNATRIVKSWELELKKSCCHVEILHISGVTETLSYLETYLWDTKCLWTKFEFQILNVTYYSKFNIQDYSYSKICICDTKDNNLVLLSMTQFR